MKTLPIIYSPDHKKHNPRWEIIEGEKEPYAEVPDRIEQIVKTLREKGMGENILPPQSFPLRHIQDVHQDHYIAYLKRSAEQQATKTGAEGFFPTFFIMDKCAPIVPATYETAVTSAHIALTGADLLKKESLVYALCRPPGHHAEKNVMGGYCYFNNAAIAAEYLSHTGKVAILDIDYHHGNGTQHIFYERDDVSYVSLHVDPSKGYPYIAGFADEKGSGKGEGFTQNFPLPPGTTEKTYEQALHKALAAIKTYNPQYLLISCGFDTYEKDPICTFKLSIPFYQTIAAQIKSLGLPTLVIQEGGYYVKDLGEIAYSFVKGLL